MKSLPGGGKGRACAVVDRRLYPGRIPRNRLCPNLHRARRYCAENYQFGWGRLIVAKFLSELRNPNATLAAKNVVNPQSGHDCHIRTVANAARARHDGKIMAIISDSEVRRGRKFEQVREGALRVFLRDGFEGASVDEIARVAGVSKATLYSYFPDKRVMFTEVFSHEIQRQATEAATELPRTPPAQEFLAYAARRVIRFTLSEFGRQMFRLVIGEVSRFPELARQFYVNGPGRLRILLIGRLRELCQRGELEIEDFDLAVDQFVQLSRSVVQDRAMLNLVDDIRPEEVERSVNGAVSMFMARYGTRKAQAGQQS